MTFPIAVLLFSAESSSLLVNYTTSQAIITLYLMNFFLI